MRRILRKIIMRYVDDENRMLSVFRKPLPFRVEPTEMRVGFTVVVTRLKDATATLT